MPLRALARVNLGAIERNVARLKAASTGGAGLCAVVKADGYGHGATQCARAALAAGASRLAVATAGEAAALRADGIEASILVMGALSGEELGVALAAGAEVVAWAPAFVELISVAAQSVVPVHVKLDSGMGRLGTRDVAEALAVAAAVDAAPGLRLAGAMTHLATADGDQEFVAAQLAAFAPFAAEVRERYPGALIHAGNSAATLRTPASHYDFTRCGIAVYGLDPMNLDSAAWGLEPALELTSYVAAVKRASVGESAGYGRRFVAERETTLGTLPIGYADGIRRAYTNNLDVLVGGRRYPLVGTVSMDNITIDLGPDAKVRVGEVATLIGAGQSAEELAQRIGTINYEVTCALSARVPRAYHRDGRLV
jgi:alanine racemase